MDLPSHQQLTGAHDVPAHKVDKRIKTHKRTVTLKQYQLVHLAAINAPLSTLIQDAIDSHYKLKQPGAVHAPNKQGKQTAMNNVRVFDNGGETFDRYTAVYVDTLERGVYFARGMSDAPNSPNGYGCSCEVDQCWPDETDDKEVSIDTLPSRVVAVIRADLDSLANE